MNRPIRRVVTGHSADGQSIFIHDGSAPNCMVMAAVGDLQIIDLWETKGAPADNTGSTDNADRPIRLEPPKNGTVFRVVDFPPDSKWREGASGREAFSSIGADHAVDESSDDPMMHTTETTDYAIVLDGEVWAVLDEDEVCLRSGDVLVQRGTNHSWSVRTDEPARVAFVLVSAAALER